MRYGTNRRCLPYWKLGGTAILALPIVLAAKLLPSRATLDVSPARDFSRGTTAARHLALTFDADDQAAPRTQVLDILEAHEVSATFFLTGRFIETYPDVVRRIVRDGHEVGNHSYDHPELTMPGPNGRQITLPEVTKEMFQEQLRKTARLFTETTGTRMASLWRAPGGEQNEQIRGWAAELGYLHVGWSQDPDTSENLDSLDWVADERSGLFFSPAQIRTRLLNFGDTRRSAANGGIALFHLGSARHPDDAVDHELDAIIEGFRGRGYRLVRVSELYRASEGAGAAGEAADDDESEGAGRR
jgi:peptidoglycan/xylan/chitin deacetylase (PgdA/CDA1 family)